MIEDAYRALLALAACVAERAASATQDDLAGLRAHGFDDRALLDATLTVGYFSFVNRLVLMLGVRLEEGYEATCGPDVVGPATSG